MLQFSPYKEPGIPVLSFFTGAGFLDMGFIQAGFKVVFHNEFNKDFADGFFHGMTTWYTKTGRDLSEVHRPVVASIDELDPNEIVKQAFGGPYRPAVFGMIGGPPCPDFSVGGKNRGGEGENGKLSKTYVDLICALKPTFFLFENVPGLFRTAKHRAFFDSLVEQLHIHGYLTDVKILNALEFGVPQDRERVFFVGIQEAWLNGNDRMPTSLPQIAAKENWFPYPEPPFKGAKTKYEWGAQNTFGAGGGVRPRGTPADLMVGAYMLSWNTMCQYANGDEYFWPYSDRFRTVAEGDDSKKSFKRLHRYRFSPTAAYGNNEVHLHPFQPRRISVREALRIQSVPDEYELPRDMSLSKKFKTVGNGVPVKLAKAMAVQFMRFLGMEPPVEKASRSTRLKRSRLRKLRAIQQTRGAVRKRRLALRARSARRAGHLKNRG